MPNLPQQPFVPADPPPAGWAAAFDAAFTRLWRTLAYTVNALCKVDTLANRTGTPILDETFAVASDTRQLFVGSGGAWINAGPRRGSQAIAAGATTATVSLSPAEPDANYVVVATPAYNTSVWITGETASAFTVNVGTAGPAGGSSVRWVLWRSD